MRSPELMCSDTSWSTGSLLPYANVTWSTSISPVLGRPSAPGHSTIDALVSSTPKIFCSAAPADCTVLYSWLSWLIGSNTCWRYSTKAATTPTSTAPRDDSQPPYPTITAVAATPAYSMNGKYFAEIRTVSMLASYWSSLVPAKRSVNESLRP